MISIVFKTCAAVAALSTLVVAAPTGQLTTVVKRDNQAPGCHDEAFIKTALSALNHHRNIHGSPDLEWDPTIATYAQGVSDKCVMVHSGGPYGENLFGMGPAPSDYLQETTDAIMAWTQEIWDYEWDKPGSSAYHATALLWKNTKKVGCAWTGPCSDGGAIFTCNFGDEVPNMLGNFKENVFPLNTPLKK